MTNISYRAPVDGNFLVWQRFLWALWSVWQSVAIDDDNCTQYKLKVSSRILSSSTLSAIFIKQSSFETIVFLFFVTFYAENYFIASGSPLTVLSTASVRSIVFLTNTLKIMMLMLRLRLVRLMLMRLMLMMVMMTIIMIDFSPGWQEIGWREGFHRCRSCLGAAGCPDHHNHGYDHDNDDQGLK